MQIKCVPIGESGWVTGACPCRSYPAIQYQALKSFLQVTFLLEPKSAQTYTCFFKINLSIFSQRFQKNDRE